MKNLLRTLTLVLAVCVLLGAMAMTVSAAGMSADEAAEYLDSYSDNMTSDPDFDSNISAAIAAAAIPQCNLTFASGQEMKDLVEGYFSVLFQANPASIGGGMPYDSFYYGVA